MSARTAPCGCVLWWSDPVAGIGEYVVGVQERCPDAQTRHDTAKTAWEQSEDRSIETEMTVFGSYYRHLIDVQLQTKSRKLRT